MTVPPGMSFYGWARDPAHEVRLGPGDPIPDEVMLQLSPNHPLLVAQPIVEVAAALTSAMAAGPAIAQASALAAAAVSAPGATVEQAAALMAAGPVGPSPI